MKGIILAGGSGTRLAPLTSIISKQLLPVYDKPMICYPLAALMSIGIRQVLIISSPQDIKHIKNFLGNGRHIGLSIKYEIQEKPRGIAQAFIIGEKFIGRDKICLILGDNIFYGSEFGIEAMHKNFNQIQNDEVGAFIFAYHVQDPERYGVVEFNKDDKVISIEEKPENPKSNWAVTGFYIYDNQVIEICKNLKPSARGELEITDVNNEYLKKGKLGAVKFKRGFAWLDAGTPDSLLESSNFIQIIEKRQGQKIACLEEIAYCKGFINKQQLKELALKYKPSSSYRKYLNSIN